jgi:ATP-dependent DNA helicase DinG
VSVSDSVAEVLIRVTGALPGGGEDRPGQVAMASAVERALQERRHLVVQAGTGTGKSLAYLLPAARSGRPVVVATATKALQDQLATKDLPFLGAQLGCDQPLSFAVLKGRSNYLCRQRATEVGGPADDPRVSGVQLFDPEGEAPEEPVDLGRFGAQLRRIISWGQRSPTGDRAELDFEPHPRAWAALSLSARECPGAFRCPSGTICFAEQARQRATEADVVVVNTHLYASNVATNGTVLPEHDVVVFDEAHQVEDIMTAGLGVEITAGRLRAVAVGARGLVGQPDAAVVDDVAGVADRLRIVLAPLVGQRVLSDTGAPYEELAAVLALAHGRLEVLQRALRRTESTGSRPDDAARRARVLIAAEHVGEEVASVAALGPDQVAWVEASGPGARNVALRAAPVEIGPVLAERLWPNVTAVLTSATVPPLVEERLGLPPVSTDHLDVGSPFPFRTCALLYCAAHLPDPRRPDPHGRLHDELATLIDAAGGRTLALFTSWRAMQAAADELRARLPFEILAQSDLPKTKLVEAFAADDSTCLFATMSFWQGGDVPGPTLSMVAIDRLPFSRPDDPLLQARRDRAGDAAFRVVDLPRATTLLAQGAGRLIRSSRDRGVVAVLDPRLATAGYRRVLLDALPPMRRTTDRDEVIEFLHAITAGRAH